ncbi:MAG TPA: T9SS type A sorting domain-containing protein [Aequorivita sp.]|nr:T9SS type A sorting domain-containing protein [Aequorivita sp.]
MNLHFKKTIILLLLCMGALYTTMAQTVNTTYATQINNTLSGLDKSKVPHKLLKDQAMEFAELGIFNGINTADNLVHTGNYTALYNTLLMARVQQGVAGLYSPQLFKDRWDTRRVPNQVVLSGIYYKYSKLKENAYPNYVNVSNNVLSDKYINGVWQNPYEEKKVFAMAAPILKFNSLAVKVKVPAALWYTNAPGEVQSIAIDFGNGTGYKPVTMDQLLYVSYTTKGLYEWKYKLTLTSGQNLYSHSKIYIDGIYAPTITPHSATPTASCPGITTQNFNGIRTYLGQAGSAILEIDYANNDCVIRKPLIVAEGFDSGLLGVENPRGENDFSTFIQEASDNTGDLADQLNTFDIIYVNWTNGKDHLLRNAYLLEEIIAWVNAQKTGSQPNVVLGQSMGGVIARYALKDMEDLNIDHETRLFVSHDAPQQGANIPLGISYFARHIIDQFIQTPLGDMNINVTGDGGSISLQDIEDLLDAPGTQQLLSHSVTSGFGVTTAEHSNWQTILDNKGYPQDTRNISLSNGNHCANPQPFAPGDDLFRLTGDGGTSLLTDFLMNMFPGLRDLGVIGLANILNEPGLLVAILPGKSSFSLDFKSRALPVVGSTTQIYKGNITFTKKILFFNVNVTLTNRSFNNPSNILSYDYYPGGAYNLFDLEGMNGNNDFGDYDISIFSQPSFDFIPVPSALDVGTGTTLNNQDYLNKYNAENPPTGNRAIPFDNFLVTYTPGSDLNEEHISFNTRNGNWLASELNLNDPNLVIDCSFFCDDQSINGPETICTTATYTIAAPNTSNITWSVSPSNAGTFQGQGTNQGIFTLSPTYNGFFTISANAYNPDCGSKTITLEVFGGKPKIELEWEWDPNARRIFMELVGANGTDITKQGVTANNVYWQKINSGNGGTFSNGTGFNKNVALPNNNSFVEIEITATNSCGNKVITFFATPPAPPGYRGIDQFDFVNNGNNLYTINNIVGDNSTPINISDYSQNEFKITAFDFTGNPVMEINNNIQIDLSSLPSGIYILKAMINDNVLTKKVFR